MALPSRSSSTWPIRDNPILKSCYERLRARGKACKCAFIAVARKLLSVLNRATRSLFRAPDLNPKKPWLFLTVAAGSAKRTSGH